MSGEILVQQLENDLVRDLCGVLLTLNTYDSLRWDTEGISLGPPPFTIPAQMTT